MKIDHFDIKVTMWQRIKFEEPKTVEEVRRVLEARNINAFWDGDRDEDGTLFENLVDSEVYEYESAEYPTDTHDKNLVLVDGSGYAQVYVPFIPFIDEQTETP